MATERTVVVAGVPDSCLRRSVSCSVRPAYLRGHRAVGAAMTRNDIGEVLMTGNDIYKEKYRRVVAGILLHGGSVNLEQALTIEGGDFSANAWIDCNRNRSSRLDATWPKVDATWSVTEEGKKWFYDQTTIPVVVQL